MGRQDSQEIGKKSHKLLALVRLFEKQSGTVTRGTVTRGAKGYLRWNAVKAKK